MRFDLVSTALGKSLIKGTTMGFSCYCVPYVQLVPDRVTESFFNNSSVKIRERVPLPTPPYHTRLTAEGISDVCDHLSMNLS